MKKLREKIYFLEQEADKELKPRRRLRRGIYLLPSVFTVGNIFFGFYAVVATVQHRYDDAAKAIGIAVVLDGLDGRVARLANATSAFGLQFDSLADVLSFGLAPAVLAAFWGFSHLGPFGWFTAFVFLVCGAMRLARFNIQAQSLKHFLGMPIPAAAGTVAAIVHYFKEPLQARTSMFAMLVLVYGLAFLMVSTVRYISLKNLNLGKGKSHLNVLVLAILVAGIYFFSEIVLLAIASAYASSGIVLRFASLFRSHTPPRSGQMEVPLKDR